MGVLPRRDRCLSLLLERSVFRLSFWTSRARPRSLPLSPRPTLPSSLARPTCPSLDLLLSPLRRSRDRDRDLWLRSWSRPWSLEWRPSRSPLATPRRSCRSPRSWPLRLGLWPPSLDSGMSRIVEPSLCFARLAGGSAISIGVLESQVPRGKEHWGCECWVLGALSRVPAAGKMRYKLQRWVELRTELEPLIFSVGRGNARLIRGLAL